VPYCERLTIYTHTHDRPTIHNAAKRFGIWFFFIQGPEPVFAPSIFFSVKFSEIQNGRACALSGSHAHTVSSSINVHFFTERSTEFFFSSWLPYYMHGQNNTAAVWTLVYAVCCYIVLLSTCIVIIMAVLDINIALLCHPWTIIYLYNIINAFGIFLEPFSILSV